MGGAGTWDLAIDHAERFAAIAPICGRVVPLMAFRLWQKPVWVVHGEMDAVVPFSHSKEMVDVLRNMGNPQLKFTALPDAGHDVWTRTYNDPALYEWFLLHTR
jgi:predicted peptidase